MTVKKSFLFFGLLMCQLGLAQHDSIILEEVIVFDRQIRNFSSSQSIIRLTDSVVSDNSPSLSTLLNYNTPIYFKENGPGMVSSPSFRGTTAQQTAVVWNGINVNSNFNGQTDFNAISTQSFDEISVRSGGGSVVYGSSAIGGSVHLNNELHFSRDFENSLNISYGSFDSAATNYRLNTGSENTALSIGVSHNRSNNDFEIPSGKNTNGQYRNTSLDFGLGIKLDQNNSLRLLSYAYDGNRHFSLISPSDTKTKYHDSNARMLLEWANTCGDLTSHLRAAYLNERYDFFDNIEQPASNFGDARTITVKYDGLYAATRDIAINFLTEVSQTDASGSDIEGQQRQIASFTALLKHQLGKFRYEFGARQEITNSYDSPVLFSAGAGYSFNDFYTLRVNASKNFRIPSFNDMYWFEGGNPDLKPETALQAEIGTVVTYKNWEISVTGYYNKMRDMIQWLPGTTALWNPVNVNDVRAFGVESVVNWKKEIAMHCFAIAATYAYTVSENERTGYQLIYVPFHKATAGIAYSYQKLSADYQLLFCGDAFTRSDNDPRYMIDAYTISNIGVAYDFGKDNIAKAGARILNVFDENYQVVAGRPFPGRNFNLFLNFKF